SGGVCSGCDGETPTCGMPICDSIADVGAAASAVSAPPFSAGATEAGGAGLRAEPEDADAWARVLAAVPIRSVRMVNCFPPRVTLRVCLSGAAVSCGGASSWRTVRTRNSHIPSYLVVRPGAFHTTLDISRTSPIVPHEFALPENLEVIHGESRQTDT